MFAMNHYLASFAADEDGAVTVDFVVLTAAITMLGLVVVTTFSPGATDLANDIEAALGNVNAE
jgi:Flp pilus assembly pilin Flp